MGVYTQLTQEQRYHIYAFMKPGFSQTDSARRIDVHKSTVCRKLRRNRDERGYRPKQADAMAFHRRINATNFAKLTPPVIALSEELIQKDFTPEQVSRFLARTQHLRISHETIYRHILNDKAKGGTLFRHLRLSHKKRRKRYGSHDHSVRYMVVSVSMSNRQS